MTASPCIPESDLAHFIRGQLEAERITEIAEHVDDCETCQDTVVALADSDDTFVAALREVPAEAPFEREAALRQGLHRIIRALRHVGSSQTEQPTSPHINRIGPYLIEEPLGRGGMGTVYRAVHCKLKRTVALKLLPAARWSNIDAISRFEREMEAIGGLDHPHIVRASDAGEDQGMHYLVMDYVEGLDLSRLVNRLGPLPVADACELVRQAAVGLQYVHENGLVHRDVKPSNLMLAWDRGGKNHGHVSVQILDLGLALLGDEHLQDTGGLTSVGQLMGTLDYMSPEQGIDSHGVDHRTDIYGLGATLFKLLTGRAPYADPRFSTLMKKMTALATKPAPSVGAIREDLPAEVVTVVDRMLARDPDERFSSAAEVAAALAPHTETADLTKLLRRGLAAEDRDQQRPVILAPNSALPSVDLQRETFNKSGHRGGRIRFWVKTLAASGAIALAGIAYYISTDYGDIVVRSDDPNAEVVVKRGDERVTSLHVKQGEGKTRVRAGNYTVELAGEASGLEINPESFDVHRDKTVTISVRERQLPTTAALQPTLSDDHASTLSQLMRTLEDFQLHRAHLLTRRGKEHPEVVALEKSMAKIEEAIQRKQSEEQAAAEPEPNTPEKVWAEAQAMFKKSDYQGAMQICNALLARNPNFGPAHLMRGMILSAIGEQEMALMALANAASYMPQSPEPALERGKIYFELEHYKNGFEEFSKAVQTDPFNVEGLIGRGKSQLKLAQVLQPSTPLLGQPDRIVLAEQAIRSLERAVDLDPGNAEADAQLALARTFLDKTAAAIRGSHRQLLNEIEAIRTKLAELLSRPNPNPREVADVDRKLEALEQMQADMVRKGIWTNEAPGGPDRSPQEVTYRGKAYSTWAGEVRTERQESVLLGAVEALAILAKGDPEKETETTQLICQMMRVHGGVDMNIDFSFEGDAATPITMRHSLVIASLAALCRMGPERTIDVLLQELTTGNTNSREFVRLACATDLVMELATLSWVKIDKNDAQRFLNGVAKRADEFPREWNVAAVHGDTKTDPTRTESDNAPPNDETSLQIDRQRYEKAKQTLRTEYGDDIAERALPKGELDSFNDTRKRRVEQQAKLQALEATHPTDHPLVRQLLLDIKRLDEINSQLTKKIQTQVDEILAGDFDFHATVYGDAEPDESENEPRYKGQTFRRWTRLLTLETDPTRLIEAVEAVAKLGSGRADREHEAAIHLMRVMRFHGMVDPTEPSATDAQRRLVLTVADAVCRLDPDVSIKAILYEIEKGNPKSRDFVRYLILKRPGQLYETSEEEKRFHEAVQIRAAEILPKLKD